MNMKMFAIGAGFLLAAMTLSAKEPVPLMTKPGKELLNEEFSGASLPAKWQPGGRLKSFSIVDGALQGVCAPDDSHGPAICVPVEGRNITVGFSVKFAKPGLVLFLVDGESKFGGTAHLLRVALGGKFAALQQDRGSLESKQAQAAEKAKAAKEYRKPAPPTKEQLANPKFYRTEMLDRKETKLDDGQWHRVLVEICGNDAVAQVDGIVLRATGSVFDEKKARLYFLIGMSGTMLIDDVKVWESEPLKH
ncbi:MAG: LamG domain-containing protein [Verrucomicrobia bacterium]|nr:LamG domain-containing protein [Verrucomicrobiota bacterium]